MTGIIDVGGGMRDIYGAGVGSPGSIDTKEGIIIYSNNISFSNVPIAKMLKEKTNE